METKKQLTAVEFLEKELFEKFAWRLSDVILFDELIAKAKEMEKEQIINAALYGFRRDSDGDDWQGDNYNAEKYYNKTFKTK